MNMITGNRYVDPCQYVDTDVVHVKYIQLGWIVYLVTVNNTKVRAN